MCVSNKIPFKKPMLIFALNVFAFDGFMFTFTFQSQCFGIFLFFQKMRQCLYALYAIRTQHMSTFVRLLSHFINK